MKSLTDNWLLQSSAELLSGNHDPLQNTAWIQNNEQTQTVEVHPICNGALQVHSLATLIEQLIMCDEINVLSGWTAAWEGRIPALDDLFGRGIIREVKCDRPDTSELSRQYVATICEKPHVKALFDQSAKLFAEGNAVYEGQVINGSIPYLILSDQLRLAYCPHPVRSRYLQGELYLDSWGRKQLLEFEKLHEGKRVELVRRKSNNRNVLTLVSRMSSIAMYCLLNSGEQTNVLHTALQLRADREFQALRELLWEIHVACESGNNEGAKKKCRSLDRAVDDASKRLGLAAVGEESGYATFSFHGLEIELPLAIPKALRLQFPRPRHSSIVYRLLAAHETSDMERALARNFGIKSKRVIQDMARLYDGTD